MFRYRWHWIFWVLSVLTVALQIPLNEAVQRKQTPLNLKNLAQEELSGSRNNWKSLEIAGDSIVSWNSNLLMPDTSVHASYFLQQTPTHWYVVERSKDEYFFSPLLKKNEDHFISTLNGEQFHLRIPKVLREQDVLLSSEAAEVELQLVNPGSNAALFTFFLMMGFLILALFLYGRKTSSGSWWFPALYIPSVLMIRWLLYVRKIFNPIFELHFFDPAVYASNFLLPSFGDLMLHIFAAFMVLQASSSALKKANKQAPFVLVLLVMIFTVDLSVDLVKGLILDSSISFELLNFYSLDALSFLSMMLSLACFVLCFYFGYIFTSVRPGRWSRWYVWIILIAVLIFFWLFQIYDGNKQWDELLTSTLIFAALLGAAQLGHMSVRLRWSLALSISIVAASYLIQQFQEQHEKEHLKIYASKLTSSNDLESEYILRQIENSLVEEFLEPTDYEQYARDRERFESRLRQLYFSGYLDKYDVQFFSFDADGNNLNGNELYARGVLNEVYNFETYPSLGNYFYRIKHPSELNGYIAKFENCDLEGSFGETFILLQPKFIQRAYFYPPFLGNRETNGPFDFDQYSYAVYSSEKLVRQKGDYPYPLQLKAERFNGQFEDQNWHHFVSVENPWTVVVISKNYGKWYQLFSWVSFMFMMLLVLLAALLGIWLLLRWLMRSIQPHKQWSLPEITGNPDLLSSRIRLAMVFMAVAGLLLSVLFNINFLNRQNQQREELLLTNKLRDVALQMQNRFDVSGKMPNQEDLLVEINEIAEAQKTDLNVFNTQGALLASTKSPVYEQAYLAPLMNVTALEKLQNDNLSQFIHTEEIGAYAFVAAYMPLFDGNRRVMAYINVPFFSESNALKRELSGFIAAILNIYVLLILLSFALATLISRRITQPLLLLKSKLSAIRFGQPNETIEWKQQDEIGELVREYNHTLMKLEESANLLARSEREGAWKEMAKQVAHEIKNPLTPMKLNIQHLQRAWKDGHPKLDEMFNKVTRVLIEQMDSLSTLATEFSSFAKMPAGNPGKCDLKALLQKSIILYGETDRLQIHSELPNEKAEIFADPEQMGRVFSNIIKNAIQSIPEGDEGRIMVRLQKDSSGWLVSISDNGSGISPDLQSKIFVPNFSTKNSGMGLGLAICKKIVDNSRGEIWFETKEGEGTTFFVRLPKG